MDLIIKAGRVIDPATGTDHVVDVLVSKGQIAGLAERIEPSPGGRTVLNAAGRIVCPGFVDLHCHLRQPGFEEKETIATGTLAAARGGFTTVCCMPNTIPPIATPAVVEEVRELARREGVVHVLPIGAVTEGRSGIRLADLRALVEAGTIAFSDDGSPVNSPDIMRRALKLSTVLGIPIIDHCEDRALSKDGSMNEGPVAQRLGFKGIPAAAEEAMVARDIQLAGETGGRIHIAHVSTAGSVELVRGAKRQGLDITAEVTPHHLALTDEAVASAGTNAKVNPPLRSRIDIEACVQGLQEGTLDAIATDHAPHTLADKAGDFRSAAFGISGFETALGSLMSLVQRGDIELPDLISRLTWDPSRIMGISGAAGTLRPGSPADVVIIDPQAEWKVDPGAFASKGTNTPLAGAILKGKVIATIVAGSLVHADPSLGLQ